MKSPLEGFKCKCRFELAEKRIDKFEDRKVEIIVSKEQEGKRLKISEQSLRDLFDTIKQTSTHVESSRRREKWAERYLNN